MDDEEKDNVIYLSTKIPEEETPSLERIRLTLERINTLMEALKDEAANRSKDDSSDRNPFR